MSLTRSPTKARGEAEEEVLEALHFVSNIAPTGPKSFIAFETEKEVRKKMEKVDPAFGYEKGGGPKAEG